MGLCCGVLWCAVLCLCGGSLCVCVFVFGCCGCGCCGCGCRRRRRRHCCCGCGCCCWWCWCCVVCTAVSSLLALQWLQVLNCRHFWSPVVKNRCLYSSVEV